MYIYFIKIFVFFLKIFLQIFVKSEGPPNVIAKVQFTFLISDMVPRKIAGTTPRQLKPL